MNKTLVLYFSVYGTTKRVAEEIARLTGADLREIRPLHPYDCNCGHYDALAAFTEQEAKQQKRPEIETITNLRDYDTIFVGYPIWWYTLPMAVYTLFEKADFSGKTLVPFNTHMGSQDGGTYRTIQELAPNAAVLKGIPLEMNQAEHGDLSIIAKWLQSLSLGGNRNE